MYALNRYNADDQFALSIPVQLPGIDAVPGCGLGF